DSLAPVQITDPAPIAFRRTPALDRLGRIGEPPARLLPLAPSRDRLGRFFVERLRDWRRTAPVADRAHPHDAFGIADAHGQLVADVHRARRFHALAVDDDAAAFHRLTREVARAEEARGPEPLVD